MVPNIVAQIPTGGPVISIVGEKCRSARNQGWSGSSFFRLIAYHYLLLLLSLPSANDPGMQGWGHWEKQFQLRRQKMDRNAIQFWNSKHNKNPWCWSLLIWKDAYDPLNRKNMLQSNIFCNFILIFKNSYLYIFAF